MINNLLNSCVKGFLVGVSFSVGLVATVAVGVTVSQTFSTGDTLTAASLNVLKAAVESIPAWTKDGADAEFSGGDVMVYGGDLVAVAVDDDAGLGAMVISNDNNNMPGALFLRARGDSGAMVEVQGGDNLGIMAAQGYDGSNPDKGFETSAFVSFVAEESGNFSTTTRGTGIYFGTTTNTTGTPKSKVAIHNTGALSIKPPGVIVMQASDTNCYYLETPTGVGAANWALATECPTYFADP
ncbi:MAG: hypothetical protein GY866_26975 [Proteobacteria bacterium]|nr:hypothetical protein [Pseudomonadota bacterium]